MKNALEMQTPCIDKRLTRDGSHFIFPAFFHTLYVLAKGGREVNIVIRSFGSELSQVADAINAFVTGCHPDYPDFEKKEWRLTKENMYLGRWKRSKEEKNAFNPYETYQLHEWKNTKEGETHSKIVASGDVEVLNLIENSHICAIQDDYFFWSDHGCQPFAGKPVWVQSPSSFHHIMFDDNIFNDSDKSIVGVRWLDAATDEQPSKEEYHEKQTKKSFDALNGAEVQKMHGKYLVRVPTIEPILSKTWFLERIDECEKKIRLTNKCY